VAAGMSRRQRWASAEDCRCRRDDCPAADRAVHL